MEFSYSVSKQYNTIYAAVQGGFLLQSFFFSLKFDVLFRSKFRFGQKVHQKNVLF